MAKTKTAKAKTAKAKSAKKPAWAMVSLELDAAIYPTAVLERAITAFSGLARIELEQVGQRQRLSFSDMAADVAALMPDEFANYALGCLVNQR